MDDSNDELNRPARLKTRLKVNDLAHSILLDRENASVLWNQIRTFDSPPTVSPPQKSLYRLFRTRLSPRGREPLWPRYPPGVGPIGFLLVPPTSPFLSLLLSLSLVTSLFVPPTQASRLVGQLLAITTSQGGACNFPGDAPNAISSMVALDHGRSEETRRLYQSSRRRPATMLSSRDQRVFSTGRDPPSNRSKRFGARKSNSEPPTRRATSLRGTR